MQIIGTTTAESIWIWFFSPVDFRSIDDDMISRFMRNYNIQELFNVMSKLFNAINLNIVNYLVVIFIDIYNVVEKTEFLLQISCFLGRY